MGATKDFIKFRKYIRAQNLKVNEQCLIELFFEYHNTQYGYSFLTFEQIMQAFNTTSKNRISSTIKKLEKKGLIRVERQYSNNRYFILNVENFIYQNNSKPNESNGKASTTGQVKFELTPKEAEVINATNFTQNQTKSLLQLCNNKVDKLISMIKYVSNKANVSNKFGYIKALLERGVNVDDTQESYKKKSINFVENCSSREYSEEWYSDIESRLLGWTLI